MHPTIDALTARAILPRGAKRRNTAPVTSAIITITIASHTRMFAGVHDEP
ncbi:MAG: hypothetical protein V9G19_05070 [Tetrasphaera sp.]